MLNLAKLNIFRLEEKNFIWNELEISFLYESFHPKEGNNPTNSKEVTECERIRKSKKYY